MRHYPYFFGIVSCIILTLCSIATVTYAAVIIDLVEPGLPSAADEYISITNNGDSTVDISKWSLQIRSDTATTFQKKNFLPGMRLDSHSTFIVANKDGRFALQSQMTYTSLSLSGDGGTAALVATTTYISGLDDPSVVSFFHFGGAIKTQSPAPSTPMPPQAIQSQPDYLQQIPSKKIWTFELSELSPRPDSGDEFIELYNFSPDAEDVSGLLLRDASGNMYALGARGESTLLGAYERRIWKRGATRIALNDTDGELVQLIDQTGKIIDSVMYSGDVPQNTAYAKLHSVWLWTLSPTPSQPNRFTQIPSPPIARANIPAGPFKILQQFTVSATDTTDPDNDIVTWHWSFGDTESAIGATSTHSFVQAGQYEITFTATDARGATSTVSRIVQVTPLDSAAPTTTSSLAISSTLSAASSELSKPPPTKKYKIPLQSKAHIYTGVISVPLGILPAHQIAVNERTVEIDTKNENSAELKRGTVVEFYATEQIKQDKPILVLEKNSHIKFLGTSAALEPVVLIGQIANLESWGFGLVTSSTDYSVMVRSKLISGKRASIGDSVQITGVVLRDSPDSLTIVPLHSQDVRAAPTSRTATQNSVSNNYTLLICTAIIFVLLHVFLTYYSKHHDSWNWKKLWVKLRIKKI